MPNSAIPWLFFKFIFMSLNILLISSQCLYDQTSLLLQLKDTLPSYDSSIFMSTKLPNWDTTKTADCCHWPGVGCDVAGHVTRLDLSSELIKGGIENSTKIFSKLSFLDNLNLADNYFGGIQIPPEFGHLVGLKTLNLSNSGFMGQIPIELSQLINLKSLDLSTLYYPRAPDLPRRLVLQNPDLSTLITNLTMLTELRLDGVNISSRGSDWCGVVSSSLLNLKVLSLEDCFLSGPLDKSLRKMNHLSELYLGLNNLSGTFPSKIFHLPKLRNLDLGYNPLLVGSLPVFGKNEMIKELILARTNFSGPLPYSIGNLTNLSSLNLFLCNFSGPIPNSMANLTQLVHLDLRFNNFTGPIPSFQRSKNLAYVTLSKNMLTGSVPSFQRSKNLAYVDLSYNMLTGLVPSFQRWKNLAHVDLSNNMLTGSVPSFQRWKNLAHVDLSNNMLTGSVPSFQRWKNLDHIDLSNNMLTGSVPSFQRWKNLTHVDLSNNMLMGSVPSTHFEGLTKLRTVDLAFNSLYGSIPASLFSLPLLQTISLSHNQFGGEMFEPRNKSFSQLWILDVSNNNLQGNVPQFLFRFTKLYRLSLSFNNFSGFQLDGTGNLGNLIYLDLSYNDLSISLSDNDSTVSVFPQLSELRLASCNLKSFPALMNQTGMIYLDLSDNQITGKIPNWVGNLSLQYLNLSSNFLEELESVVTISRLFSVDLSFNWLKGEIPIPSSSAFYVDYSNNYFSSIPADIGNNLTFAYYFSVSKNFLKGQIPQSICSSFKLAVLDLSNNKFDGSIPSCIIENMTKTLGVLNLGNNLLTGTMKGKFHKNCALETLDFNMNHLEGKVPKSLANCKVLEVLNLRNNQINDVFPCFLKTTSNLRVIVLRFNDFQGDIRCLDGIAWPKLQIIDLAQNNFGGELPSDSFYKWEAMMSHDFGPNHTTLEFLTFYRYYYYQYKVTVTNKGQEMELVKILTIYISIDFSSNMFEGHIPEAIGGLKSLYVLNLSHNALMSQIPSSIGNLRQLGSLDLSRNKLSGEIPNQLTRLSFLVVLNLSYNNLVGHIPSGSQFNTFLSSSYEGNPNLCGFPLNSTCTRTTLVVPFPTSSSKYTHSNAHEFCFAVAVGYLVVLGMFIGSLLLCKKWKKWVFKHADRILELMFHLEDKQRKRTRQRQAYRNPIRRPS